ncbi:MAG TPA: hypothetical protein VHZ24_21250 [Pirellulales bacterium]|jgi:hypothetical protein|nr:hypothetical protein [Pirellulales bacterium]
MPANESAARLSPTWSRPVCCLATLAIVWHLAGVLVGPISLPPSILGSAAQRYLFRRYNELMYLDHAYKFFAPDPGPSHLIRYDIEMADGSHTTGVFPNLADEWPRLFYHRYFMLSERLANGPPDADTPMTADWTHRPVTRWEHGLAQSYANHLLAHYHGRSVTLSLVQHMLISPEQVKEGDKLDDPRSYITRPLGTYYSVETL